jgi:hypothetical protein
MAEAASFPSSRTDLMDDDFEGEQASSSATTVKSKGEND